MNLLAKVSVFSSKKGLLKPVSSRCILGGRPRGRAVEGDSSTALGEEWLLSFFSSTILLVSGVSFFKGRAVFFCLGGGVISFCLGGVISFCFSFGFGGVISLTGSALAPFDLLLRVMISSGSFDLDSGLDDITIGEI